VTGGAASFDPAVLRGLPAPERSFASDTTAPALPEVVEALAEANSGHVGSYSEDPLTADVMERFRRALADNEAQIRLAFSGTGANMLGIGMSGYPRIVVAEQSHIACDEESGPLYLSGATQTTLPAPDGRLTPTSVADALTAGPALVCLTEATEDGTLYGLDRLAEICAVAHSRDSAVLIDGARLPHALVAQGAELAQAWATGVDHLVMGGTKAGLMAAEAVISRSGDPAWWRRSGQFPAKTRFVAAQWSAVFPDRWMAAAAVANARAADLVELLAADGIHPVHPAEVNLVFLDLQPAAAEALAAWGPASLWDRPGRIRLAASWDTTLEDVQRLARGIVASAR
jgi:threonine aldolase